MERELAGAQRELAAAEAHGSELTALEERYWHGFNEFQLALREQLEERDAFNYRWERGGGGGGRGGGRGAGEQRTPSAGART